jgi:hypothetical protein
MHELGGPRYIQIQFLEFDVIFTIEYLEETVIELLFSIRLNQLLMQAHLLFD